MRDAGNQAPTCVRYGAAALVLCCVLAWPLSASAFSEPQIYADQAVTGGGGGRWFTGSPAEGYDCSVCHTGQRPFPLYQSGLPLDGWVPGAGYTIKLSWPEAAAESLNAQASGLRPSTSVVAELIAEDGGPSGTIDLQPSFASPGELCTPAADSRGAVLAAGVFPVNGDDPVMRATRCSATQKNQRCVVAASACGSSELRIRWTAPERWRGPIWFSASLVSTLHATGVPNDGADGVTTLAIPIQAASEPTPYNVELHGGCTVAGPPLRAAPTRAWILALCVIALRASRRALALILLVGCADAPPAKLENVGLFTPGYRPESVLTPWAAGAAAVDGGVSQERMCMGQTFGTINDADGGASFPGGSLKVDFTTGLLPVGDYDKAGMQENYGVVWIEDDMGRYVSGLTQWGVKYRLRLTTWIFGSGRTPAEPPKGRLGCEDPDIVSQPSIHMHATQSATWKGTDTAKQVVPDGNYTLWFEVQIDERHIQTAVAFPFIKGRMPWTLTLPPATPLQALTLTYTPES